MLPSHVTGVVGVRTLAINAWPTAWLSTAISRALLSVIVGYRAEFQRGRREFTE